MREDNESFRIDSEYFKKEYLENEKKIEKYPTKTLEELSYRITNGHTPYGENLLNNEVKFITAEFIDDFVITEVKKFISLNSHFNYLKRSILENGNVIIAIKGKVGNAVPIFNINENININQDVAKIAVNNSVINIFYLSAFLNSRYGKKQLYKESTGQINPFIALGTLRKIKIPILPMEFQKEIEKMVKDSHKALEESKELYKKAQQTLYLELGLDPKNPLQSLLDSHTQDSTKPLNIFIRTLKESFLQTGRLDSEYYQAKFSKNEEIIKSGTYKALSELVRVKKSIEPGSSYYKDSGIPFVRVSNLSKFGLGNSDIYLDSKDFNNGELESLYPKKDTILLSKDGSVGIAYCVSEDLECVSSGAILHLTIIDSNVLPQYLTLMLNSIFIKLQAERDCGGSIIEHWRIEEIEKVLIPILPFKIQENIETLIKKSFELKEVSSKLLQEAKAKVESAITTRA